MAMAAAIANEHDLEELLQRITDPTTESSDELAVNLFCSSVRSDAILIKKATELIVSKIKSPNVTTSRKAIELLEECMSKCGLEFQTTIARFQFLNELIRLVSKRFAGDETPAEIRNKILDCLSLWTVQYPDRSKIKEAYETLLRSGVQHEVTPTVAPSCRRTNFIDVENEKLLKKLLQSNNREDFLRANLLIKYLVKQDAKKTELAARQRLELQEARNSATILSQIFDRWAEDGKVDNEELATEIYNICKKSKQIVIRMPEIIEDNEELLGDAIEVNDLLHGVIDNYEKLVSNNKVQATPPTVKQQPNVPDLMYTADSARNNVSNLAPNPLDELSDVFSKSVHTSPDWEKFLLTPVPVNLESLSAKVEQSTNDSKDHNAATKGRRTLPTIDKLSEELFMENIGSSERVGSFKREPSKIPINDLLADSKDQKETNVNVTESKNVINSDKTLPVGHHEPFAEISASLLESMLGNASKTSNTIDCLLEAFVETKTDNQEQLSAADSNENRAKSDSLLDDALLLVESSNHATEKSEISHHVDNVPVTDDEDMVKISEEADASPKRIKHLSEIHVELNSIRPSNERPRVVMDDIQGLRVTLNFALDRPSTNVSVLVISTINQSSLPVCNYQLDASVKKPCKLRLLPPTGSALPGVKPFRTASEDIQQILLLFNPTQMSVELTCIIGYQQGDDPDPVKESVIVKDIPYCD